MDKVLKYLAYVAALAAGLWYSVPEVIKWLMLLMLLDTLIGTILAAKSGQLSSSKAWSGGTKKVGTLIVIGLVMILENGLNFFPGVPIMSAVTGYYIWTEALSIITNAAALGVPIPDIIAQALASASPDKLPAPALIADPSPSGEVTTSVSEMTPPPDPRTMRGA